MELRRDYTRPRWRWLRATQPSLLLHEPLRDPDQPGMALKGDLLAAHTSAPPASSLIGVPAPSGGHSAIPICSAIPLLGLLSLKGTPTLTHSDHRLTGTEPPPSFHIRGNHLMPKHSSKPHTHQGYRGLIPIQGACKALPRRSSSKTTTPLQPPQGGYPLPAPYLAPAQGTYAHTATDCH